MTIKDHDGEPMLVDLSTMFLAAGVATYAITVPDTDAFPPKWRGQRGVLFEFAVDGIRALRAFVPAAAFPLGAGAEFHELLDRFHTAEGAARLDAAAARAHEANYLAGYLPDSPVIHCPGCGSRLFGAVARRGGCLACYPDLPPGDAAEVAP